MHLLLLAIGVNVLSLIVYMIVMIVQDSRRYEPDFTSLDD